MILLNLKPFEVFDTNSALFMYKVSYVLEMFYFHGSQAAS